MVSRSHPPSPPSAARRSLRVGYVALVDCAPLAVACAEGLFARRGLHVQLCPEPGWASIREKLIYNELDAAQCLTGLALALHYGIGCLSQPLVIPLVLNANGNAITLANSIPTEVRGQPGALKRHLAARSRPRSSTRLFTLATVQPYSSHYILLCDWLAREGLHPGRDVEIVFLPPAVIPRHLATGTIDGYCVGEPWNSLAVLDRLGWCAATSVDLADGHPEKVLAVRDSVQRERSAEIHAFTAAVLEACRLCDDPAYRPTLCSLLSRPEWLDTRIEVIRNSLIGPFQTGCGPARTLPNLHLFFDEAVNAPTLHHASWIIAGMRQAGLLEGQRISGLTSLFRNDLYEGARAALPATSRIPALAARSLSTATATTTTTTT